MAKTFCIEISKRDLEDAVGMDLSNADCEMIVDRLEPLMSSYQMEELIKDAAQQAGILDDEDED
jgi:hypothetical protein